MDNKELATLIAGRLFKCGNGEEADRLLLIKEDRSGAAEVGNARYLAGWSKGPVIDAIQDALEAATSTKEGKPI